MCDGIHKNEEKYVDYKYIFNVLLFKLDTRFLMDIQDELNIEPKQR